MSHAPPKLRSLTLALIGTTVIAACSEDPFPIAPRGLPRPTTQREIAAIDSQARTGRDVEAAATRIALAVPGFGGFAWDTANGDLVIWVKDMNRGAAASAAVAQHLAANYRGPGGKAGPNPRVRVREANFGFLELGNIRDRVNAALENEPALLGVGISEQTNTVSIVAQASAVARITTRLNDVGVPDAAARIQSVDELYLVDSYDPNDPTTWPLPFEDVPIDTAFGSGAPTYLDSRHSAVRGGARISFYVAVNDPLYGPILQSAGCTAGPMVKTLDGVLRMLTASHCSKQWGGMSGGGSNYYQPYPQPRTDKTQPSPEAPFGFEFFDAGWKSMLPSYLAYKWADALIATVMAAGPQVGDFGKIHRPASSRADHFIPASGARYQIDATRPAFTIVGTAAVGGSGERVEKVGASTGWTYGYVEEPCYDSHFRTQTSSGSFLTRTTRCIVKNSAPAYRGDSGGPYFRIVGNPADSRVELLGTSQGGTPMVYSTFSPLNNIAMELGPLTYFP